MSGVDVQFGVTSILSTKDFSWVFLVEWIMLICLATFVIWYISQLLGWILTQLVGWYLQHKFGVWVKFEAVKISLLGARIIFKNVIYIGPNQSFRVVHGTLTWRYWLRAHRRTAIRQPRGTEESQLPCGLYLEVYGLEWFVYNRSYAYDALKPECPSVLAEEVGKTISKELSYVEHQIAALLPLHIQAHSAAMIVGNNDTECVAVLKVEDTQCIVDIDHASNDYDRYMIRHTLKLSKPALSLLSNPDHADSTLIASTTDNNAQKTKLKKRKTRKSTSKSDIYNDRDHGDDTDPDASGGDPSLGGEGEIPKESHKNKRRSRGQSKIPKWLEKMLLKDKNRRAKGSSGPWLGLHRYVAENWEAQKDAAKLADLPVEYARVSTVLESETMDLEMMFDVLGPTPDPDAKEDQSHASSSGYTESAENSKSSETQLPIFQVNMKVNDVVINYGPWAERQRQQMMATFAPRHCFDEVIVTNPKPGEPRKLPNFTLFIELGGQSALRVPVRESSKDLAFIEEYYKTGGDSQRNFGWLEIAASSGSTISYEMPYYACDHSGTQTTMNCDLRKPEVRSSVNHGVLLFAARHEISVTQQIPLKWNGTQHWKVNQHSSGMDLFLLREHLSLLSDTIEDFASGVPVPYELFTPLILDVSYRIDGLALYMNVNKKNIINNPTSLTENMYLVLGSDRVELDWHIPMAEIAPAESSYRFVLLSECVTMDLSAPPWHTLHGFLDSPRLAKVENFRVEMHDYTTKTSQNSQIGAPGGPRNINTSVIDVSGTHFTMIAHGFLIDYIMTIRENYFGHDYHFQTTEEFLNKAQNQDGEHYDFTRLSPDSDIHMHVFSEGACFIIPSHLYTASDSLTLNVPQLGLDCRFTNYYMNLEVEFPMITANANMKVDPARVLDLGHHPEWGTPAFKISYLQARGHRMFGLPPAEPTYICKWDFDIGDISGEGGAELLSLVSCAGNCLGHSFHDRENKPIQKPTELFDVTFISMKTGLVTFVLRSSGDPYVILETSPIDIKADDFATERYSGKKTFSIPRIELTGIENQNVVFECQTSIFMSAFENAVDPKRHFDEQQKHLALHDCLFHRCPFLLREDVKQSPPYNIDFATTNMFGALRGQAGSTIVTPSLSLPFFAPQATREVLDILYPQAGGLQYDPWNNSETSSANSSGSSKSQYEPSAAYTFSGASTSNSDNSSSPPRAGTPLYDDEFTDSRSRTPQGDDTTSFAEPFEFHFDSKGSDEFRSAKVDFDLRPVPWFDDAPYLPAKDPRFEYQNIILQVQELSIVVAPEAILLAQSFASSTAPVDFASTLDKLQIALVRSLILAELRICIRTHIIIPELKLQFCESSTFGKANKDNDQDDHLTLTCNDLDIMFRKSKSPIEAESKIGFHLEMSRFLLDLRKAQQSETLAFPTLNAASFTVSRAVLWYVEGSDDFGSLSLRFADVDLVVNPDQINWTMDYCGKVAGQVVDVSNKAKRRREDIRKLRGGKESSDTECVFYALTMAGDRMGIEQDSYVLSRPTGAIQSETHVRSNFSWRIAMRLRHLLQQLSQDHIAAQEAQIYDGLYELPSDAREQAMNVFRQWRSWEHTDDLNNAAIFKLVFTSDSSKSFVLNLRFGFFVDSLVVRLPYSAPTYERFFRLDEIESQVILKQNAESRNVNFTIKCTKAHTQIGIELLGTVITIMERLPEVKSLYKSRSTDSDYMDLSSLGSELEKSNAQALQSTEAQDSQEEKSSPLLQMSVTAFIHDLTVEISFKSLMVEFQNHQMQLATIIENIDQDTLFHSSTLVCGQSGIRAFSYETQTDIADFLLSSPSLGLASEIRDGTSTTTWQTTGATILSLAVHNTMRDTVGVIVQFMETDLPVFKESFRRIQYLELAKPRSTMTRLSSASSSSSLFEGLNMGIGAVKIKIGILKDIRMVISGQQLEIGVRSPSSVTSLFQIDLDNITLMAQYKDSTVLAKCQIDEIKSLMRYEMSLKAMEALLRISSVRLETLSLLWILEYVRRHDIVGQAREVMQAFESLDFMDAQETLSVASSDHSLKVNSIPFNIRMRAALGDFQVLLPLDTCSFTLRLSSLRCAYESFSSFEDIEMGRASPKTFTSGLQELSVWLRTPSNVSRKLVSVHLSGTKRRDVESDEIELHSDFSIVELDPETVGALFIAGQKLKKYGKEAFGSVMQQAPPQSPIVDKEEGEIPEKSWFTSSLERLRVKLSLSNVAFNWFTDSSSSEGISVGYETLDIQIAKLIANMELNGLYVTPYVRKEPNVKKPFAERPNTAYLPKVSVHGIILAKPFREDFVYLKMSGESVSISLTPAIASWVANIITSSEVARATVNHLEQTPQSPISGSVSENADIGLGRGPQKRTPSWMRLPFNMHCEVNFKKAVLKLSEDNPLVRKEEPSLELKSPSVQFIGEYWRAPAKMTSRDQVLLEIHISNSSNTVYSKAMQEVKGILDSVSSILSRKHAQRRDTIGGRHRSMTFLTVERPALDLASALTAPNKRDSEATGSIDVNLEELLAHHAVTFKLHMGHQELYLSCMPFAKIGAQISADSLYFILTTPRDIKRGAHVAVNGEIRGAQVSLQHMYSREISTSVSIRSLAMALIYKKRSDSSTPLQIGVNMHDPRLVLKLDQIHDFRMFMDVWRFFESSTDSGAYGTESFTKNDIEKSARHKIGEQYRKAMASASLALSFNISFFNFSTALYLGQSIGDGVITIDRAWVAGFKISAAEQHLLAGIDTCSVESEGRVGGSVDLRKLSLRLSVLVRDNLDLPLIQMSTGLGEAKFYVSLDFHPFLTGSAKAMQFSLTNQERERESGDRLFAACNFESVSIVFTALIASHLFDVGTLFKRLISQISSRATYYSASAEGFSNRLHEERVATRRLTLESAATNLERRRSQSQSHGEGGAEDTGATKEASSDTDSISQLLSDLGLHVIFDIRIGRAMIYAFPTEFSDPLALKVFTENVSINYWQLARVSQEVEIRSNIDMTMTSFTTGLSSIRGGGYRKALTDLDVADFLNFVHTSSSGGTILSIPEFSTSMRSSENLGKIVHYTFSNTLNGSVEVGWNLGSINFIREMGESHQHAWNLRQQVNRLPHYRASTDLGSTDLGSTDLGSTDLGSVDSGVESETARERSASESRRLPPAFGEKDSGDVIQIYDYRYIADEPPIIVIPQLRDLGEATPPIEWLGVNRERLPALIHYYLIRNLNNAVAEIELLYGDLLGRI